MSTVKELEKKIDNLASAEDYNNLSSRVERLEEKFSAEKFDKRIDSIIEKYCQMESFKNRTRNIIDEQSKQDNFIQRIMGYAGREINRQKLRSQSTAVSILITAVVTIVVSVVTQVVIYYVTH